MKTIKWLFAGILVGVIAVAFRDMERGEWLRPTVPQRRIPAGAEEPVLGYDGMDQETLLDWLTDAELDAAALERVLRYEEQNLAREPVLSLLEDLLG